MKQFLIIFLLPVFAFAQPVVNNYPSLSLHGSARGWGMGDAGIASATQGQSLNYNVAKTAFTQYFHQASADYIPWMRSVNEDAKFMRVDYLASLNNTSAAGIAINYLDLGNVAMRNDYGATLGLYRSAEFNVAGSYALQLGANASLGTTLRLIGSRYFEEGMVNRYSVCGDIGYYHSASLSEGATLEWGAVVSNLGPAINLPTTAGLGVAYRFHDQANSQYHFTLDASRLFTDKSIRINAGAEYGYAEQFFLRGGVSLENADKGNRKFISLGAGYKGFVSDQQWGLDFLYLVPFGVKAGLSPFDRMMGLTLSLSIGSFQ